MIKTIKSENKHRVYLFSQNILRLINSDIEITDNDILFDEEQYYYVIELTDEQYNLLPITFKNKIDYF